MDEVFGRKNFFSDICWNSRKSKQSDAKISLAHNHVISYAKQKDIFFLNRLPVDESKYDSLDDDPNGKWKADPFDAPQVRKNLEYDILNPNTGVTYKPPKGRHWRTTEAEYWKYFEKGMIVFGKNGTAKPQLKRYLKDAQNKGDVVDTWWDDAGTATEGTKELQALYGGSVSFDTPKPERLLELITMISTNPNDLILDSFLGSGTTAAVAHKMGRRFIGIEMGEHAKTHCVSRLQKVVDGEQGGISKAVNWNGGGGFNFYELGETIFDENGAINPNIKFENLAAHIWFYETKTAYSQCEKSPLLGIQDGVAFYLLYNGILGDKKVNGGNVLTTPLLKTLPAHNGPKIIYGEKCILNAARLKGLDITFKQTPYDVKAR